MARCFVPVVIGPPGSTGAPGPVGPMGPQGPPGAGTQGLAVSFADAEVPAGAVDGANAIFALANVPSPVASLQVFRNGILQKAGSDYNLIGGTAVGGMVVQFRPASIPQALDTLQVWYRF